MTQVLKNRKGVTLVELLAVIVIMGIIAAIAVPAIGGLIDNSRRKAVEGELTSIEEAARLFAVNADNNDYTVADIDPEYISVDTTFESIEFTVSNGTVTFKVVTNVPVTFNKHTFKVSYNGTAWTVEKS
jgi:type IV pilus assembly protein PilA